MTSTPSTRPRSRATTAQGPSVKVYLVLVRVPVPQTGKSNTKVVAAKLNRTCAEEVQKLVPNSYINKVVADKTPADARSVMRWL